jgi:thiol-disulfide isomerase/thioredoxin
VSKRKRANTTKNKKNKTTFAVLAAIIILILASTVAAFTILQEQDNPQNQNNSKNLDDSDNSLVFKGEDFAFYDLEGNVKHLSDYVGKVVILDLWATYCQPCQYQMIELKKVYENYSQEDVKILSINVHPPDTKDVIKDFLYQFEQSGYKLEWFFGREKENLDEYVHGGGIPAMTIFDKLGRIQKKESGLSFYDEVPQELQSQKDFLLLKDEIDKLL